MRPHRRALLLAALTAGTALWATACGRKVTRALVAPTDVATLDQRSPYLKAHRSDGHVYVLSQWGTFYLDNYKQLNIYHYIIHLSIVLLIRLIQD